MSRFAFVLILLLFLPGRLLAQSPTTGTANPLAQTEREALLLSLQAFVDSLSAPPGYAREVYRYPRFGRLDPVEPPPSISSVAAFPELRVTGILFDEKDPRASTAMLRVTTRGVTTRHVVRAGDDFFDQQYYVLAIGPNHVIVEVSVYGGVRVDTLVHNPNRSSIAQTSR